MSEERVIEVKELPIRLGQFLKLANIVQDGLEAKVRIQYEEIVVNGQIETQRGKKLNFGDVVEFEGVAYKVG